MATAFDTLEYAKRLETAKVPREQAEAHAEAARDFVMAELVTKTDLAVAVSEMKANGEAIALRVVLANLAVIGLALAVARILFV